MADKFSKDDVHKIVEQELGGIKDQFKKAFQEALKNGIKNNTFYFDTETTGTTSVDVPVTLGTYKNGVRGNYILDYGDEKITASNIVKAMSISDNATGELIDSSVQLRKMFGIRNMGANVKADTLEKEVLKQLRNKNGKIKQNMISVQDIVKMFEDNQTSGMAGFNSQFDIGQIENYIKKAGQEDAQELLKRFKAATKKVKDVRQNTQKTLKKLDTGGIKMDPKFLKGTTLQNFIKMALGATDDSAHDASADAFSTALLDSQNTEFNNMVKQVVNIVNKIAKDMGISAITTKTRGSRSYEVYSDDFVDLFAEVWNEAVSVVHGVPNTIGGGNRGTAASKVETAKVKTQQKAVSEARKKVGALFKQFGDGSNKQTVAQKAMTGQHLLDRAKRLGINATGLTSAGFGKSIAQDTTQLANYSVAQYLETIINTAESKGYGVVLNRKGNNIELGLYNKVDQPDESNLDLSKIAKVEIGLVDDQGLITIGNQSLVNTLLPTIEWAKDSKGNLVANPTLSTAMEQQFAGLARAIESDRFGRRMASGDYGSASSFMQFVSRDALKNTPSGLNSNILKELDDKAALKTPEQGVGLMSQGSIMKIAQTLYRNPKFQNVVNQLYTEQEEKLATAQGRKPRNKAVNPNELTQEEITAINVAFSMIANGWYGANDDRVANMEDSVIKRILSNQDTIDLLKRDFMPFIEAGMVPRVNSLKEEQFISGIFRISGAQDTMFGNQFVDPGTRAQYQVGNYARKRSEPTFARGNPFASQMGIENGIDYSDKKVYGQYTGARVSDDKIYEALTQLNVNEQVLASVLEGGIIMPKSMQKELESYRESSAEVYYSGSGKGEDKKLLQKLVQVTGLAQEDIDRLWRGDISRLTPTGDIELKKDVKLNKETTLAAGTIVKAIEKTASGFKIISDVYSKAEEGTKILTGVGGRQTARFLDDDLFKQLTSQMGIGDAQFLVENKDISTRNLMETFRGRIGYIINEAKAVGKSWNEISKALSSMPVLGKAIKRIGTGENTKFDLTAFYDTQSGEYKYTDKKGKVKSLFSGETQEEIKDQIKKALIEGQGSAIEYLGKALLGETHYNETKEYIGSSINVAKMVPYYNPVGGGSSALIEAQGGVRATRRERDALEESFRRYGQQIDDKEGLNLYAEAEREVYGNMGPQAQKAQKDLEKIRNAYNNRTVDKNKPTIELRWGGGTHDNIIDISELVDHMEYGKDGKLGVSQEDFDKSIGRAIEKARQVSGFRNAQVALNLESVMDASDNFTMSDQSNKLLSLANIKYSSLRDGSYMPSITDTGITSIIGKIKDAVASGEELDLSLLADSLYEDYKTILTDKDSALNEKANSSYLPHATHAKAVGLNTGTVEARGRTSAYNTVYANKKYFSDLLSTQVGGTKEDRAKNINSLYRLLMSGKSGGFVSTDTEEKYKNLDDLEAVLQLPAKELKKLEKELIDLIVQQLEDGRKILGQFHRYPSTSGLDIHTGYWGINDSLDYGSLGIGRGTSLLFNADYDGDTIQARLAMLDKTFSSQGEYDKAYKAGTEIAQMESRVAELMAEWEEANASIRTQEEQAEKVADSIANPGDAEFAGIMSKFNKQYVGRFSNLSTNLRRSKEFVGFGKLGVNASEEDKRMAAYSTIINAFTEALEQDAISAKKVAERLQKGDVGLNELTPLYNALAQGNFAEAIQRSFDLGILKTNENGTIDSRQFALASAILGVTDSETAKSLGINIDEGGGALGINKDTLIKSFQVLEKYAESRGIQLGDMMWNREDRLTGQAFRAKAKGKSIPLPKSTTSPTTSPIKIDDEVEYKAFLEVQNSKDYDLDHTREIFDPITGKTVSTNISPTGLLEAGKAPLAPAQQQAAERSAALGTYMHKVNELLIKANAQNGVADLTPDLMQELREAQITLGKALGTLTTEMLDEYNQRAESLYEYARNNGLKDLLSGDVLTEKTVGGYLNGVGYIGGQTDAIQFGDDGVHLLDWKFSQQGGPGDEQTVMKRIVQASFYLQAVQKELEEQQRQLAGKSNRTSEEDAQLKLVESRLTSFAKGAKIDVFRSYKDKSGGFTNELLTSDKLEDVIVNQILRGAWGNGDAGLPSGYVDFTGIDLDKLGIMFYNSRVSTAASQAARDKGIGTGNFYSNLDDENKAIGRYNSYLREENKIKADQYETEQKIALLQRQGKTQDDEEIKNLQRHNEELEKKLQLLQTEEYYYKDVQYQEGQDSVTGQKFGYLGNLVLSQEGMEAVGAVQGVRGAELEARKAQIDQSYAGRFQREDVKEQKRLVDQYLKNYQQQLQMQRNIERAQQVVDTSSGARKKEYEKLTQDYKEQLAAIKAAAPILDEQRGTINGIQVSTEEITRLQQTRNALDQNQVTQMQKINAQAKQQKGLIQQIAEGFKASFRNLVDYSAAYQVIGYMRQMFSTTIQTTKDLDSAMVNLQIASGETYDSIYEMTKGFNELGKEMGRSTRDVATAADDWLRAGYAADEANQLVKASMDLSTLGQIESADATSYLISMLKGWKLEVEDITEVVDKLTAVDRSIIYLY